MAIIQSLPLGGSGSTYTNMTTDEAIAGTNTEKRVVSAKVLNDAIDTKISDLVNSAPETLDTLNELASALGNDPNFATTVANQIGSKANDSDVVHKSGNETVNGTKTFTLGPVCSNSATTNGFFIKNAAIARNEVPTSMYHSTFRVNDKNGNIFGEFCVEKSTTGASLLNMNIRTEKDDGTQIAKSLYLNLKNDGSDISFYPSTNNEFSLGTASYKWKDVYATTLHGDVDFSITEAQIAAIVV